VTTKTAEMKKNKLTSTRNRLHPNCVICSRSNARGLQLDFSLCENGGIAADFEIDETLEGYPGVPHGGVISSVFDGAMGHCLFAQGCTPVTAQLSIRFRHPIAMHKSATVSARIVKSSNSFYVLEAEIVQNGQIKATAEGKFVDNPNLMNEKDAIYERSSNKNRGKNR
jgi:acyl-coenzyme A thioesterase PaaI-like protein